MTVSNSWLVNVQVSINTTVIQAPSFNQCLLIGVMPFGSVNGVQFPPSSWGTNTYQTYSSLTGFLTDFTPLLVAAKAVMFTTGNELLVNRIQWLIDAVTAFFAQTPTPTILYVGAILSDYISIPNYPAIFANFAAVQNGFYGCTICDLILANTFSTCVVSITTNAATTIPILTTVTPQTATQPYTLLQEFDAPAAGTYLVTFYSTDGATVIPPATFTAISPTNSAVTAVTNVAASINGIPGFLTSGTGLTTAMLALRTSGNQKKLFQDTLSNSIAESVQSGGGSQDIAIFYHLYNLQSWRDPLTASLSAACLSEYFTDLFNIGVGMKPLSSMQLKGTVTDPTITTANIGTPGQPGGPNNLIGWDNNVYAAFGNTSTIGLVQYGYMSNSIASAQVYLDQVVGADFLQFTAQTDLVTFILNQQPIGGILYNDFGIQQILSVFKNSVQKAVNQNILQPFDNSDFVYSTYAQVSPTDITNRIYKDLYFNGEFLSRIQMIQLNVTLSL